VSTNEHHDVAVGSDRPGVESSDLLVPRTAAYSDASTDLAVSRDGKRCAAQRSDDRGEPDRVTSADSLDSRLGPAATFATTEHFNLQAARALTVSEANGRAAIYLAALSSNLIALAFIGQTSELGAAFYAFALILLPVLAFVGVVTFVRLVQSSIEEIAYAHRIGLVRGYYLRVTPELEPYLVVVRGTRSAAPHDGERLTPSTRQLTLTVAGMVAVINSVVVAACAGLVLAAVGVGPNAIPVAVGAVVGAGAFSLHERTTVAPATPTAQRLSIAPRSLPTITTGRPGLQEQSPCRRPQARRRGHPRTRETEGKGHDHNPR
jgi:hypothetical protein